MQAFQRSRGHKKDEFLSRFQSKLDEQRADFGNLCSEADQLLLVNNFSNFTLTEWTVSVDDTNSSSEEDNEFKRTLKTQIQIAFDLPPTPSAKAKPIDKLAIEASKHPMYQHAASLFQLYDQLIDKHHQASCLVQDAQPKETLGKSWEEDSKTLADLLETGRRVAERQINNELSKDRDGGERKAVSAEEEKENRVAESYFGVKTREHKNVMGLNDVLAQAEKVMELVTTGLPTTDD